MLTPVRTLSHLLEPLTQPSLTAASAASKHPKESFVNNEPEFRWALLQDQMAFDKLHEGIKKFAEDGETLKALLRKKIAA